MSNYYYPSSVKPNTVNFIVTGKRPVVDEVNNLTGIIFPKKPVSESEKNKAIKNFFIFIGIGIACFIFGFLISNISGNRGSGAGIVRLMGYTILFLGAPFSVIGAFYYLSGMFRSGRKTKVEKSFQWVWENSIIGDPDLFGKKNKRFGSLQYAIDTLERAVPGDIDKDIVGEYITRLRESLESAMEQTTAKARSKKLGTDGTPLKNIKFEKKEELFPNVSEVSATITFSDVLVSQNNKNETVYYITAIIELHVTQIFIKAGKYWYPYDLTPDFQLRQISR